MKAKTMVDPLKEPKDETGAQRECKKSPCRTLVHKIAKRHTHTTTTLQICITRGPTFFQSTAEYQTICIGPILVQYLVFGGECGIVDS